MSNMPNKALKWEKTKSVKFCRGYACTSLRSPERAICWYLFRPDWLGAVGGGTPLKQKQRTSKTILQK